MADYQLLLTCEGKTLTLLQWAKSMGLPPEALRNRIKAGWPVEHAIATSYPLEIDGYSSKRIVASTEPVNEL